MMTATRLPRSRSTIAICGLAGDQQAATIGQACLDPGATKATFGTGAFVLTQYGDRLPASLIQGQRDFFGAHTYGRIDEEGAFHTMWSGDRSEVNAADIHVH